MEQEKDEPSNPTQDPDHQAVTFNVVAVAEMEVEKKGEQDQHKGPGVGCARGRQTLKSSCSCNRGPGRGRQTLKSSKGQNHNHEVIFQSTDIRLRKAISTTAARSVVTIVAAGDAGHPGEQGSGHDHGRRAPVGVGRGATAVPVLGSPLA